MDALSALFTQIKKQSLAHGNGLGLLNVLIGRRIASADGAVVSSGMTWRELAGWLKKMRWDVSLAEELGLDSKDLPPKDRQRFWYAVIARAGVDTPAAANAGDAFARKLEQHGYCVGPPPRL